MWANKLSYEQNFVLTLTLNLKRPFALVKVKVCKSLQNYKNVKVWEVFIITITNS